MAWEFENDAMPGIRLVRLTAICETRLETRFLSEDYQNAISVALRILLYYVSAIIFTTTIPNYKES